jgi:hypothetical protein
MTILFSGLLALAGCGDRTGQGPAEPDQPVPDVAKPASEPASDPKACETAEDCVPVACFCECSGCGGFFYQDIVNRESVDAWYEEHGCEPATACAEVCCEPSKVVCEDGGCAVRKLAGSP